MKIKPKTEPKAQLHFPLFHFCLFSERLYTEPLREHDKKDFSAHKKRSREQEFLLLEHEKVLSEHGKKKKLYISVTFSRAHEIQLELWKTSLL